MPGMLGIQITILFGIKWCLELQAWLFYILKIGAKKLIECLGLKRLLY